MSKHNAPPRPLSKQHSWAPDMWREEAWLKRRSSYGEGGAGLRRNKSLSDEDLEELKGCIDLGFGFGVDSPDVNPKLSETIPALGLYYAVNRQYSSNLSRSSSSSSLMASDSDTDSVVSIIDQCDDAELVKTRLRQWARVVACVIRGSSSILTTSQKNVETESYKTSSLDGGDSLEGMES